MKLKYHVKLQIGALIDGKFTVIGSFLNDIYAKILLKNLQGNNNTIICTVGR